MTELVDKIRSRGYWDVVIRPGHFDDNRVPYEKLAHILTAAVVRFRGWPVPAVDPRDDFTRGDKWIGQDVDAALVSHYEAWRFFTSGQFGHLRVVSADWRTGSEATRIPDDYTSVIEVWEILYYLTEVFELAARLALSPAGDETMTVDVTLHGLSRERALVVGQRDRADFMFPFRAPGGDLRRVRTSSREELVAGAREFAVETALDMFRRFGWEPSVAQLAGHQSQLIQGR